MPRFAANLSMLYPERDFLDRFAAARADGFDAVEFLFPYDWPAEEISARLRDNGLSQALFNLPPGDWAAGERGLSILPDRTQEFRDGLARAIDYAAALGCPTLHCMAGITPPGIEPERLRETWLDNLAHAADRLAGAGLTLVIEPINTRDMPGYHLNTTTQAAEVLRAVDAPNLRIQFDIYHAQIMEGDLARRIEALADRIGHVQIAGVPDRNEPDTGEIAYPFLFDLLDRLGYAGFIGCEYRPAGDTSAGLGWFAPWRR